MRDLRFLPIQALHRWDKNIHHFLHSFCYICDPEFWSCKGVLENEELMDDCDKVFRVVRIFFKNWTLV